MSKNKTKKSVKGGLFVRHYSRCIGKLEELESNIFHLGEAEICRIGGSYESWTKVSSKDLIEWYDEVFNKYIDVDSKEIEDNRYEWMMNNLLARIEVCTMKIEALEMK